MIGVAAIASARFAAVNAMRTDGIAQYAYVDNPTFKTDTAGAFSIWYRPTTVLVANGAKGIIGYGSIDATTRHVWIEQRYNSSVNIPIAYRNQPCLSTVIRATGAPAGTITQYNHIFVAGALTHLVVNSDGTAYVNGALVGSTTWIIPPATGAWLNSLNAANNRLCFGTSYTAGAPRDFGDQDQAQAIYFNNVVTAGEVTALYNGGNPRSLRGMTFGATPISWWEFGGRGDTGATILDRIGTNHLTTVASPTFVSFT